MLKELAIEALETAKKRGKVDDKTSPQKVVNDLMLELSELKCAIDIRERTINQFGYVDSFALHPIDSEAYGEIFKNSAGDEIADVIIAALTLSELCGFDIDWYVKHKMEYNKQRND